MRIITDTLTGRRCRMGAPRDLCTLPDGGQGWQIVGAAGSRAVITWVRTDVHKVTVYARLHDATGYPFQRHQQTRGLVYESFTGVTSVRADRTGGWFLAFDYNGDPLTVYPPAPARFSWRTFARRAVLAAALFL